MKEFTYKKPVVTSLQYIRSPISHRLSRRNEPDVRILLRDGSHVVASWKKRGDFRTRQRCSSQDEQRSSIYTRIRDRRRVRRGRRSGLFRLEQATAIRRLRSYEIW